MTKLYGSADFVNLPYTFTKPSFVEKNSSVGKADPRNDAQTCFVYITT